MKFKTTAKAVRDGYYYIISAGYCDLQSLLRRENPMAYGAGVYGWAFDLYQIDEWPGVAIVTGYRPPKAKNAKDDYKIEREFEKRAAEIKYSENEKENLRKLIAEYIETMIIRNH